MAIATIMKKRKGKKFPLKNKGQKNKGPRKQVDLSKIKYCSCQKLGHYDKDCRSKRRNFKRYNASTADAEDDPHVKFLYLGQVFPCVLCLFPRERSPWGAKC